MVVGHHAATPDRYEYRSSRGKRAAFQRILGFQFSQDRVEFWLHDRASSPGAWVHCREGDDDMSAGHEGRFRHDSAAPYAHGIGGTPGATTHRIAVLDLRAVAVRMAAAACTLCLLGATCRRRPDARPHHHEDARRQLHAKPARRDLHHHRQQPRPGRRPIGQHRHRHRHAAARRPHRDIDQWQRLELHATVRTLQPIRRQRGARRRDELSAAHPRSWMSPTTRRPRSPTT